MITMSNVGLNSNIYDISSRYLEILNRFLVRGNYDPANVPPELFKEVEGFLNQLSDKSGRDFQIQMVAQIIQTHLQKRHGGENIDIFLQKMLVHLRDGTITNADALARISILTEALDEECDESFSRIRAGK